MQKPSTIFKYENFTTQSLQNLKAQGIYFSSPLGFNDPYDCAIQAGITELSDADVEKIRAKYLAENDLPSPVRHQLTIETTGELRNMFTNSAKGVLHETRNNFLKDRGVACFSERNDDLLMWSHYGGRYKGFCLEFSTELPPFHNIRKVEYRTAMPKIDLMPMLLHDDYDQIIDLFCTKSASWSYEQEWRSIHQNGGTLYTYEPESLRSVYFGPDIDDLSLEIICLILAGQNPGVKLWKGRRSTEEFKVIFENFEYISYAEAKKRGLRE